MLTITETIARWACDLKYENLTPASIDAAKRFLYDTIGCALGVVLVGMLFVLVRTLSRVDLTHITRVEAN